MRPNPLISDAGKDKQKTREQLLTELAGLQVIVTALKDAQAGCNRIVDMLDGIAEPLLFLDDAARITYANSAAGRLFDTGHEQLPGKRLWDVYPKSKDTLFYNVFAKAAADRNPASFTERHLRQSKWFEVDLYPVAGGMVVLFHDITVRRHKDELQRLALVLLHNMKENIFLLRADGRLFHVNTETRLSLGYSTEELVRKCIFDLVPQANLRQWQDILDQIRQKGSNTFESKLLAKDGREFPVEVYANFIELYGNSYYTISARDITERKQAEQARALLASIVHTAYEAIMSLTPEGVISSWNHGAERLYGYTADETIGNYASMLAPRDRQTEIAEVLERMRSEGLPVHYETVRLRKDGTLIDISLTLSPIVDSSGAFLGSSAIVHDISERKRAEEAQERSVKDFRSIVTRNADAMIILDLEGYVQYVNPRVESLYNIPASDFVGQLFGYPLLLDDPVEMYILKEFKKFVAVEMRMVEIEWQGKPSYLLSLQDITERKRAEEALQAAKAQAELYVDLMGHDIKNMNHVAMASLELALMDFEREGKLDASDIPLLESSLNSLNSSSQLISNVQKLQRMSTEGISRKAINVIAMLESVIQEFRQAPGKDLIIDFSRTGNCMVSANELLKDVFVNLISNAIKHSRTDQSLTIGISADNVVEHGKKYCRFIIEDNGPGIPDDTKEKLFTRLTRGATKARGSGLGLYLVRTLVKHYGGSIAVEDRVPGDYRQGAKFVVTIPSAE